MRNHRISKKLVKILNLLTGHEICEPAEACNKKKKKAHEFSKPILSIFEISREFAPPIFGTVDSGILHKKDKGDVRELGGWQRCKGPTAAFSFDLADAVAFDSTNESFDCCVLFFSFFCLFTEGHE